MRLTSWSPVAKSPVLKRVRSSSNSWRQSDRPAASTSANDRVSLGAMPPPCTPAGADSTSGPGSSVEGGHHPAHRVHPALQLVERRGERRQADPQATGVAVVGEHVALPQGPHHLLHPRV